MGTIWASALPCTQRWSTGGRPATPRIRSECPKCVCVQGSDLEEDQCHRRRLSRCRRKSQSVSTGQKEEKFRMTLDVFWPLPATSQGPPGNSLSCPTSPPTRLPLDARLRTTLSIRCSELRCATILPVHFPFRAKGRAKPKSAQGRAKSGPARPNFGRNRPNWGRAWPNWGSESAHSLAQSRSELGRVRPKFGQHRPKFGGHDPIPPKLADISAAQVWLTSAKVGRNRRRCGRISSKPVQLGP